MRKQDATLLACSFGGMVLGIFMPFMAEPLRWVPRTTMLAMLFVSFLSVNGREVWLNVRHYPLAVMLLVALKLVVMPMACWCVFRLVLPEYALGAALLGGASTAVAAPMFTFMLRADHILVLVGLVSTSLLLPFVLPAVLAFLGSLAQAEGGMQVDLPVLPMVISLAVMMVLPFLASQFVRGKAPSVMDRVMLWRQPLFVVLSSAANLAIFAQYSQVILDSPQYVLTALSGAVLAAAVLFVLAALATFRFSPARQLAFVVSCVAVNSVAVLVISVDFFGAPEALLTAMYSLPFFGALPFYRLLGKFRGHTPD